jgi:hypothetical protein
MIGKHHVNVLQAISNKSNHQAYFVPQQALQGGGKEACSSFFLLKTAVL